MAKQKSKHTLHIAKLLKNWRPGRGDAVKAAARADVAPKKRTLKKTGKKKTKLARRSPFLKHGGGSSGAITDALNRAPETPVPPAADETQVNDQGGDQGDDQAQ